jgi:hypothetical protein
MLFKKLSLVTSDNIERFFELANLIQPRLIRQTSCLLHDRKWSKSQAAIRSNASKPLIFNSIGAISPAHF